VKYALRAWLAVGILAGFYVVCLALVAVLGYGAYLLNKIGGATAAGHIWVLLIVVVIAVMRGIFALREETPLDQGRLLVGEAEQPELWREVKELAEFAHTRPPDEIWLTADVNAGVMEETKMLGLVGGTRRMVLGAPLTIGLSRQQLRSVLAHELGHYSGRHTALAALTYRGAEAIQGTLVNLEDNLIHKPLELYGCMYWAVSQTVNRRQELEADRLSGELVGPGVAAAALQQAEVLDPAWREFVDSYVAPAWTPGSGPETCSADFGRSWTTRNGSASWLKSVRTGRTRLRVRQSGTHVHQEAPCGIPPPRSSPNPAAATCPGVRSCWSPCTSGRSGSRCASSRRAGKTPPSDGRV
jgi:Zn-dependent protease with chaperone function